MTRRTLPMAALALALALTACGGGGEETTPTEPSPTVTASPTGPYLAPSDDDESDEEAPAGDDSLENAAADQAAEDGAAAAALATADVWVQGKELDQQEWNTQLLDTIAPVSHPAYESRFWGYRIEATAVTGDPEVTTATMTTATVVVPTDAGDLTLTVTRADETSEWLTTAIEADSSQAS